MKNLTAILKSVSIQSTKSIAIIYAKNILLQMLMLIY